MTTAAPPAQNFDPFDPQVIAWGNWVMNNHMQRWAYEARLRWVGHELKEVRR